MANLHTLLCFSNWKSTSPLSLLIYTGNYQLRGDGTVMSLTGEWTKSGHTENIHTAWAGRLARTRYLCYTRCSGRGKTNFDSTYQRNNPNCFIVWDKLHKVKSHKGGWWNGNPDMSSLTDDRIDDSTRKCILLKRRMNYDSFHIKQTYLWQRALRAPSTSTDIITNWPANHLALASKVQIRYLRSLKADSTVCYPSSLLLSEPCFALNGKAPWSSLQHEKDLG